MSQSKAEGAYELQVQRSRGLLASRRVCAAAATFRRFAGLIVFVTLAISATACAELEPVMGKFLNATPTPGVHTSWAAAQIAKPAQIAASPTPQPKTEATPTEAEVSEPTPAADERPVITMVIVEEDPQSIDPEQAPPATNATGKYILVSISEQHLYAYEGGQLIYSYVASTGMGNSTRAGSFQILDKIPSAYGENWNIWMPNWMGIYWSGSLENGIHALPILPGGGRLWAGYLGTPISYGCVVLGVDEALQLYDWAEVGTPVDIRW